MLESHVFLAVIQYQASLIFSVYLVMVYVTTYKSILDKLGQKPPKTKQKMYFMKLLIHIFIST